MLIVTRKVGQVVFIGEGIEVMVTEARGKYVKLGIKAPKDVPIYREEAKDKMPDFMTMKAQMEMHDGSFSAGMD